MSSPKIEKIKRKIYDVVKYCNYFPWMPDSWYLKLLFRATQGYNLDLANPKTYNEKLQWLKLYDRRPEYTDMADKYKVRQVIADKIGEEYSIPLLGVWDNFDDIDFSKLPNQFVLKCNHDSHSVFVCKDKSSFDPKTIRDRFVASLKKNFYLHGREWVYKDIVPKIIAEEYMKDDSGKSLTDYKFLCFNGVPKLILVVSGRYTKDFYQDIYDSNWKKTEMRQDCIPNSPNIMERPTFLDDALELSRKLSYGIPFLRVDWYYTNRRLYLGEFTFYDNCGFSCYEPKGSDGILGSWITLPTV